MNGDLEEKLVENAKVAADALHRYMKGTAKPSETVNLKVRTACMMVGHLQKFLGSKGANNSLAFAVTRAVAKDKGELRKLIKANIPAVNV